MKILGPTVMTLSLFTVESSIKGVAFDSDTILLEIAPKLCLWSIGILFGILLSNRTIIRGETHFVVKEKLQFTLLYVLFAWVVTVVLSNKSILVFHQANVWTPALDFMVSASIVLAGTAVGATIALARKVEDNV